MRKIKFRAFDTKSNVWRYWTVFEDCMCDLLVYNSIDKESLGEWTGLKDNNDGSEIYEGDILKVKVNMMAGYDHEGNDIYETETVYSPVIFKNGTFGIKLAPWDCEHINWFELGDSDSVQVIGNIWGNGDLINATKKTKTLKW